LNLPGEFQIRVFTPPGSDAAALMNFAPARDLAFDECADCSACSQSAAHFSGRRSAVSGLAMRDDLGVKPRDDLFGVAAGASTQ
jgi:hypothetical protein